MRHLIATFLVLFSWAVAAVGIPPHAAGMDSMMGQPVAMSMDTTAEMAAGNAVTCLSDPMCGEQQDACAIICAVPISWFVPASVDHAVFLIPTEWALAPRADADGQIPPGKDRPPNIRLS